MRKDFLWNSDKNERNEPLSEETSFRPMQSSALVQHTANLKLVSSLWSSCARQNELGRALRIMNHAGRILWKAAALQRQSGHHSPICLLKGLLKRSMSVNAERLPSEDDDSNSLMEMDDDSSHYLAEYNEFCQARHRKRQSVSWNPFGEAREASFPEDQEIHRTTKRRKIESR